MMVFDQYPKLAGGAWAVDPGELKEAFLFLTHVSQQSSDTDLSSYRVEVSDEDGGNARYIPVENTPMNRVLMALRDWMHEEPVEKYISVGWRIISLTQLIKSGALTEWVNTTPEDESLRIPGPVIYVAATLPLEDPRGFNPDAFTQAVREIMVSGL